MIVFIKSVQTDTLKHIDAGVEGKAHNQRQYNEYGKVVQHRHLRLHQYALMGLGDGQ